MKSSTTTARNKSRIDLTPTHVKPSQDELFARLDKLRARMATEGIDHYVMIDPDDVFFLTNFANYVHEHPFILVVSQAGGCKFVVPKLERPHVATRAIGDIELIDYAESPAPVGQRWIDWFKDVLAGSAVVGFESTCPHFLSSAIESEGRCLDIVEELRAIKSPYELGRIQYTPVTWRPRRTTRFSPRPKSARRCARRQAGSPGCS